MDKALPGDSGVAPDALPTREALTLALDAQREACLRLGSPFTARLVDVLRRDHLEGGATTAILASCGTRPVHDAAVLRLLSALHRLVLKGKEPELAAYYPSVGGQDGPDLDATLLSVISRRHKELLTEMGLSVQTNETGRSVVAMAVLRSLPHLGVTKVVWREVGASAGLNLNFHRYCYETEDSRVGSQDSEVLINREWSCLPGRGHDPVPEVIDTVGCDPSPIDPTTNDGRLQLLSYIWPDDSIRRSRMQQALIVASRYPPRVDRASADDWIGRMEPPKDAALVVFHSIVWQYLDTGVRRRMRNNLRDLGTHTEELPVIWARMEPAGEVADVQLTVWRNGKERSATIATVGYHGQNYCPLST